MSRWRCVFQPQAWPGQLSRCWQSRKNFCSLGFRLIQSQEIVWLNNLSGFNLTSLESELAAQDIQIVRCASDGGLDKGVTADIVSKLCYEGHLREAVEALEVLVQTELFISRSLFYAVLKQCVVNRDLVLGRRVHAFTVRKGYESDTFLGNHILRMYASHGRLQDAMHVFELVAEPDAYMWSSIISAHVKHGRHRSATQLYDRMRRSGVKPDAHVFVAVLQACAKGADLKTGQQVHADVIVSGIEPDLFGWNCLLNMYAKCGSLQDARRVFDGLRHKDVVTWNAMIAGYAQQGMVQEAFSLFSAMQVEGGCVPDSVTFVCLLHACTSVGTAALKRGKHLHAQIRQSGHHKDMSVGNSLVNMYAKCGSLEHARRVFDGLCQKDVVTWTAMIAAYSQQGMGQEALLLYSDMEDEGIAVPDSVTFLCLLQACTSLGTQALEKGKQLHGQIRERGHEGDVLIASSLVNMYAKCGSLDEAQKFFNRIGDKNEVAWTAIIAAYSQQGMGHEALCLYSAMQEEGMCAANATTFVYLLQACASVGTPALEIGQQLHVQIRERGHQADVFVSSSVVNMYAKCGSLEDAKRVFNGLDQKNVVTWNAMIAGYSQQGMGQEALGLYCAMQEGGTAVPNSVTFVSLLQACASLGTPGLEKGKHLHTQIRQQGYQADAFVINSLVNMYAKCGSLEDAKRLFDRLGKKDVGAWTAMIAGYAQQGMGHEALRLYAAMQEEGMAVPNSVTFVCLLHACADLAALHVGRQLHAKILQQGLQDDVYVAGSLINMYGKAGRMVDAQQVFDKLPEKDVVAWSALIAGYTCEGNTEMVFDLVQRMGEDGMLPDGITFLSVLAVCSHAGLVNKGWKYFETMSRHHGIIPTGDHYTCMVDLMGRAGQLDEALAFVETMPMEPKAAVWHTLLGACQKWGNVEIGQLAFNESVKLDRKDTTAHVLMLNIYIGSQMWDQAQQMHARRTRIRAWKQPGQSWWTDEHGLVHSFLVGDEKRPQGLSSLKQTRVPI